jgi:PKD repeat protein
MFGPDIDKLRVFVKKQGDPAVLVNTITGQQQNLSTASWQKRTVSLLAYEGDTVQIIFKAYRDGSGAFSYRADIAIDDVKIDETATCPAPNVLASNITFNSAELNWLGRANTSAVEYGPTGFTQGNGTMVGAQNQNALLTGLSANTTYDAYVQDTCTSSLTSSWTLVQFTTLACPAVTATGSISGNSASIDGFGTTADADSSIWYWGDGTNSLGDTASHTYTSFGLFDIYHVVYNSCGNVDSLQLSYSYCDTTLVDYSYIVNGLSVDFDATSSTGTALDYYWQFGDGATASSATPSHVYTASGTYTITLLLVNSCGDTTTTTFDLTLCPLVTLGFTSTVTGSTFSFTATPASLSNYQWSFGDGNTATGLTANNTYTTQGTFTVTITAEDSCGNVFSYSDDVATCDVPSGDFSFNIVSTSPNGMVVNFTASATGADEYHWYWGDGTNDKGTTPNAQHTYGVITLNYVVNLILINECGDSTVITRGLNEVGVNEEEIPVNIYPNPTTSFVEVDLPQAIDATLSIFNAQGQLIMAEQLVNASFNKIDVSELPSGSYTLLVMMDNRPYYFSISKI